MDFIRYKEGYKYQLSEDYKHNLAITIAQPIENGFLSLRPVSMSRAVLTCHAGYVWDGPSGPTIDTLNFMRGSLVHDALYQLMREWKLPGYYRKLADQYLYEICRDDGMSRIRAWYVYVSVRKFAKKAAQKNGRPVLTAPKYKGDPSC